MMTAHQTTVFLDRYAQKDEFGQAIETHEEDMWARVSRAMSDSPEEQMRFFELLKGFKFVPGGRILAGAGTGTEVTFYNCYVIPVESRARRQSRTGSAPAGHWQENCFLPKPADMGNDSRESIIDTLGVMVDILSHGGGVGINWSTLRPKGAYLKRLNGTAGGPIGWMEVASAAVGEVEQGGSRRGAAMFMLDDWHPDLLDFINVKRDLSKIEHANLSIAVSDAFMQAVRDDSTWTTMFPHTDHPAYNAEWDGDIQAWLAKHGQDSVRFYDTQPARAIFRQIAEMAWDNGEPGLVYLDRYNKLSTGGMVERLISVNPCGEQGLGAYSVCNLGSMNLAAYVKRDPNSDPLSGEMVFDWDSFEEDVTQAVRFLDNAIDKNFYFLPENEAIQKKLRRMGLGAMGLADALIKMGKRYGSPEAVAFTEVVFQTLKDRAIEASMELAEEKGAAPAWDDEMWHRPYLAEYETRHAIGKPRHFERRPLRNIFLLTQAPTGTTSILAGVSSGIEPWFNWGYWREDRTGKHWVEPQVVADYKVLHADPTLPRHFVAANDVSIEEHIAMQAAAQKYIDSSISKTVNAPNSHTVEDVEKLYMLAYESGLKGIAYFRDDCGRAQVLNNVKVEQPQEAGLTAPLQARIDELEAQLAEAVPHFIKRKRPVVAKGTTRRVKTTAGTAYVTVNRNEDGEPFEVFVNVGKAGTDVMVMGEAIGRILSLAVKNGATLSELGSQLQGVGGHSKFNPALPSAIGGALLAEDMEPVVVGFDPAGGIDQTEVSIYDGDKEVWRSIGTVKPGSMEFSLNFETQPKSKPNSGQLCGECKNLAVVREEGCMKCQSCGWSAC